MNECFYSIQGEGLRAGTANIFVRFANCNLRCSKEGEAQFDCDSEFLSYREYNLDELVQFVQACAPHIPAGGAKGAGAIIFTGGEPGLQLDQDLIDRFHDAGYYLSVESNGTCELPSGLDWITISPKTAEHTLRQKKAHEVKYVRHKGQGIPKPTIEADYYLLSPAWGADGLDRENLEWCIQLVKENPAWRLSVQLHKIWRIR